MADLRVAVILSGQDQASAPIQKVSGALAGLTQAALAPTRAIGGLVDGLGKVGLMRLGVDAVRDAVIGLGQALGIGINAEMDDVRAQLLAFTKDGARAEQILKEIRAEADKTPFSFQAMAKATAGLLPAAKQAAEPYMNLVKTAEILAASNPAEGLEGAAFALREAVSGDFTSIIERFNLPRQYINQLKEEGVPALEIVRRAMLEMGYDAELVSNMAATARGRWSTLMDTFDGIRSRISAPMFEQLKGGLESLQGTLDRNMDVLGGWADLIGEGIGRRVGSVLQSLGDGLARLASNQELQRWGVRIVAAMDVVMDALGTLASTFGTAFGVIWDTVSTVGQAIYEAMSWINPWAEHSPSLVSQVESGVDAVVEKYSSLARIKAPLEDAGRAIQGLGKEAGKRAIDTLKDQVASAKDRVDLLKDALSGAKDRLRALADTPLAGSKAFSDRAFALDMAIEGAQLKLTNLRLGKGPAGEIAKVEKELEKLRLQADQVRLQERLKFEPQRRQIQEMVDPKVEKSFSEIAKGIGETRGDIETLTPELDRATEAWQTQQTALEAAQKAYEAATAAAKGAGASAGPAANNLKGLSESVSTLADTKAKIEEWRASFDRTRASVQQALSPITTAFYNLEGRVIAFRHALSAGTLDKWFDNLWADLGSFAGGVQAWIGENGPRLREKWEKEWGPAVTQWAKDNGPKAVEKLGELSGKVLAWIADEAPKLASKFEKEWIPRAVDWAKSLYRELEPKLERWVQDTYNWIVQERIVLKFFDAGVTLGRGLLRGIGEGIKDIPGAVLDYLKTPPPESREFRSWITDFAGLTGPGGRYSVITEKDRGTSVLDWGPGGPRIEPSHAPFGSPILPSAATGIPRMLNDMPTGPMSDQEADRLAGYATGGSFIVGGVGGTDSQLVQFMATPGEKVTIAPPGRGARPGVSIEFKGPLVGSAVVRDESDLRRIGEMVNEGLRRLEERIMGRLEEDWLSAEAQGVGA